MSTQYPSGIDNTTTLPLVFDNLTEVKADTVNRLRAAIIAIESTLGINPQGSFTNSGGVSSRFNSIDATIVTLNTAVTNVVTEVTNIISTIDGEHLDLGTPSGGFLTGITTLQDTAKVTETLNTFNNIMFYLAPAQPQSMDNLSVDAVTSIPIISSSSAKVADVTGHSAGYFKPGFPAGSPNYRITKTQVFTLTTHNTLDSTTGFSDADKGVVDLFINGIIVSTFSLVNAFDENFRINPSGQGITYDGNTGSSTPPLLIADSHLQIYSVALFNNFPLWQKGVIHISNSTLSPGYNTFQIRHTVGSTQRMSQIFELFYDSGSTSPSFPSTPGLSINGIASNFNYLSGIKYLTTGDSLLLTATINNTFVNTYLETPINYSFTSGITSATSGLIADSGNVSVGPTGTNTAPNSTDHITINKVFSITITNQQTINCIATIVYINIYGANFQSQSASQNMLLNTYNVNVSTASTDIFVDEAYRLNPDDNGLGSGVAYPNDYTNVPPSITGNWNSQNALINGNAQVYNFALRYPTLDFTSGYIPSQGGSTNYSGFNNTNAHSGQVYYRAMFSNGNPRSIGTLTINGITLIDLTQFSPNVKVEMKLPGITSWLDFSLPFDNGTFNGSLGQGCRSGSSGSSFGWSVGTFTTASSGFMYILRITLFNTVRTITSLSESFTQSF
jgi:hypothetical protein